MVCGVDDLALKGFVQQAPRIGGGLLFSSRGDDPLTAPNTTRVGRACPRFATGSGRLRPSVGFALEASMLQGFKAAGGASRALHAG